MTRTRKTILALACTGALAFAGSASAGGTATLGILGTVIGTCQFTNTNYLMAFGQLDPSTTSNAVQTTAISYLCTNGTAASSVMINGQSSSTVSNAGLIGSLTTSLPVQLTWTTPATTGTGFAAGATPITFNITGTILASDLNNAVAGQYTTRQPIVLAP